VPLSSCTWVQDLRTAAPQSSFPLRPHTLSPAEVKPFCHPAPALLLECHCCPIQDPVCCCAIQGPECHHPCSGRRSTTLALQAKTVRTVCQGLPSAVEVATGCATCAFSRTEPNGPSPTQSSRREALLLESRRASNESNLRHPCPASRLSCYGDTEGAMNPISGTLVPPRTSPATGHSERATNRISRTLVPHRVFLPLGFMRSGR
jgi:hypothetical protein